MENCCVGTGTAVLGAKRLAGAALLRGDDFQAFGMAIMIKRALT